LKERINFTKAIVEGLTKPASFKGFMFFYDEKVHALAVRVGNNGSKYFVFCRKIQGRAVRIPIGRYPDFSIEQARGKATELNAMVSRGEDPTQAKKELSQVPTLGVAFTTYIEQYAKSHCKTWEVMIYCFKRYLDHWKNKKLDSITRSDVQSLVNRLGRENGRATANRTYELFRAVVNRSKSLEIYSGENPADGVAKFKLQSRDRFLQADEIPRLFAALDKETSLIRDFVYMCLLTGARRSNVAAMRWQEVNLEAKTWRMPESKNGQPHTVPLVPKAHEILKSRHQLSTSEWIFPGTGKTGHLVSPKSAWLRIRKKANLEDVHLHDLRRTLGSWQAATGASLHVIGKTLNHKDSNTTAVYARLNLDPVRQAMEVATDAMVAASEKQSNESAHEDNLRSDNVRPFRLRKTVEF
jgi:integrase